MTGSAVGVRHSDAHGAGFSGLQTCGSVWICPVCSAKILARRSVETGVMLLAWENLGGAHVMGTLTMRHHRGQSLSVLWSTLASAWKSVIDGGVWRRWRARLGSPGLVKVVEVTHGVNGWHVHIHFVLLVAGSTSQADVKGFASWLLPKWARALESAGAPGALELGQDVHLIDGVAAASAVGHYLAKSTAYGKAESLGRELFGSWSKDTGNFSSTEPVWHLAEEFGATGDLEMLELWHEYEAASHGKRQFSVSNGLRELLGVVAEKTDEEIAAEEAGDRDLLLITRAGWRRVLSMQWETTHILDVLERGGVGAVLGLLDEFGIEYEEVS